jgi:hypothetical protein
METKNDRYIVIEAERLVLFMMEVNTHLARGYNPAGGVSVRINPTTNKTYYLQALMKGENN